MNPFKRSILDLTRFYYAKVSRTSLDLLNFIKFEKKRHGTNEKTTKDAIMTPRMHILNLNLLFETISGDIK